MSILKITTGTSLRSIFRSLNSCRGARMVSNFLKSDEPISSDESRISCLSSSSPLLMLSPRSSYEYYDFYKFAENRVLSIPKSESGYATRIVGSSKGWLACFNRRRREVYLSNPLSGRRINLPPIHNLSIPEENLRGGYGCIKKIIISCSDPESEECRAIMTFNTMNRLAFCCPGRGTTEWTIFPSHQGNYYQDYRDFVYCGAQQLLFSVRFANDNQFEAWDLRNPLSPSLVWSCGFRQLEKGIDRVEYLWDKWALMAVAWSGERDYLVVSQQGELFALRRYINRSMLPDGSCAPIDSAEDYEYNERYPSKTVSFDVHKIVRERGGGKRIEMDGHLDGLVMFIGGASDGMAMPATDVDGFQPNSICFTDDAYGFNVYGTDNGIYHYNKNTFSSCYYPLDYQSLKNKILPPPLWLAPTNVGKNKGGGREVCSSTCKDGE